MMLEPDDAKALASKIIARSRADSCTVWISGGHVRNFRFARNDATTNGTVSTIGVSIGSNFGQKSGTATVNALDDEAISRAQSRSEETARLTPANPEFMPPLGPQTYATAGARFDASTAKVGSAELARATKSAIDTAAHRDVTVTGYGETNHNFNALANSAGLFVYERGTDAEFTVTARSTKRSWSGWSGVSQNRFSALNTGHLGTRAVEKASMEGTPADLDPGTYTVILEPAAVADLVLALIRNMDARSADEGRSFLTKNGGGTKLGERLLNEHVTITSDPEDHLAPETLYGEDGVAKRRTLWIENGIVKNLSYSRFWAQKMGREPLPRARNVVMSGGSVSIDDMIRDTKRGVLVTRLWYIRSVDPKTLLITGMTRDGNFLIENGKVTGPALNLRFNESPLGVLNNIVAMGSLERAVGSESYGASIAVPPLLVNGFTFSSKSSGI